MDYKVLKLAQFNFEEAQGFLKRVAKNNADYKNTIEIDSKFVINEHNHTHLTFVFFYYEVILEGEEL